jgi:hypothetical protein
VEVLDEILGEFVPATKGPSWTAIVVGEQSGRIRHSRLAPFSRDQRFTVAFAHSQAADASSSAVPDHPVAATAHSSRSCLLAPISTNAANNTDGNANFRNGVHAFNLRL